MTSMIDRNTLVKLCRDLIQSPSINPPAETAGCAEIMVEFFNKNDIRTEIVEGRSGAVNIVARMAGQADGSRLLLNGHLDVVPPGPGWSVDPFGAELKDGRIYGRGAVDMKSGLAAMAMAMVTLKKSGFPFAGEIIFTGVADEETGSRWGTRHLLDMGLIEAVDYAVVAEPTYLKVMPGNRGLRWLDITISGRAAHAGRPHLGINAVSLAAKLVQSIEMLQFTESNNAFEIPRPTMAVTMIQGGRQANIVPDSCCLTMDRRMIPGETAHSVISEVEALIRPLVEAEGGAVINVQARPDYWDPFLLSNDEPIVKLMVESVAEVTGRPVTILGKGACTDASHLFNRAGIPTVIFGPGDERLAHQVDEWVGITDLVQAAETYFHLMKKVLRPT
ncbi:MAG: M20 family metallopeptidase [Deltaproteobacteria bacterium]|nr:M20 family metallopeptidase [Deltaproteobacteria bacterium]